MVDGQTHSKIEKVFNQTVKHGTDIFALYALLRLLMRGWRMRGDFDWKRLMLFIGFLISLAAVFITVLEPIATRILAGMLAALIAIYNFTRDRKKRESQASAPLQDANKHVS